jgi:hypothetical protein
MITEQTAREIITTERATAIHKSFHQAWNDVRKDRSRYAIWNRTRANMVFERLAVRLQENFANDNGVSFSFANETVRALFDDKINARCKKADDRGLGHNVPTVANDLFCAQSSLPGLEPPGKIEIVYVLNFFGTEISRIMVQARDGDARLWAYEIDDAATADSTTPFPAPIMPPVGDAADLVKPRTKPVIKDGSEQKPE